MEDVDAGILFVAAAGNSARDTDQTPSYPASYDSPNIISVAASTSTPAATTESRITRRTVIGPG